MIELRVESIYPELILFYIYSMSGQQLHIYGEILPHDGRKFPQFSRVAEMEKIYLIPKKISSFWIIWNKERFYLMMGGNLLNSLD